MTEQEQGEKELGPCRVCGLTGYPLSLGGPSICPACDCGMRADPRELRRLREQIASLHADLTRLKAAVDAADRLMAGCIEDVLPAKEWQAWRRTHRDALCDSPVVHSDLTRLTEERGWQPIATAPKDGTQIWLWWDGKRRLAHWHEAVNPPSIGGRFANWLTDDKGSVSAVTRPTHWLPLPSGPTTP